MNIQTPAEITDASIEVLHDISTALTKNGVKNWIDFGTLLGAFREGTIIGHDYDIDLCVFVEEPWVIEKVDGVIKEYNQVGKYWLNVCAGRDPSKIYQLMIENRDRVNNATNAGLRFDIYMVYADAIGCKSRLKFFDFECHNFFIDELETIRLSDKTLPAPRHVEKFLRYRYGDNLMTAEIHCQKLNTPWSHVTRNVNRPLRKVVAYTSGVYDLMHVGHVRLFQRMKERFDEVVVGVHSDDAITHKPKPIIPYEQRLEMVRSCKYVDRVAENAPLVTTDAVLDDECADYVVAGREAPEYIAKMYPVSNDRLHLIDRTENICTSKLKSVLGTEITQYL